MTKQEIDALVDEHIARNIAKIDIFKHTSKSGQVRRWAILRTTTGRYITSTPSCALSAKDDNQEAGEQLAIANAKNELAYKLLFDKGYTPEEVKALKALINIINKANPLTAPTEGVEDDEFLTVLDNLMRYANQNQNNRVKIEWDGKIIGSVTFVQERGETLIKWEGDKDKAMIQIRQGLAGHIVEQPCPPKKATRKRKAKQEVQPKNPQTTDNPDSDSTPHI